MEQNTFMEQSLDDLLPLSRLKAEAPTESRFDGLNITITNDADANINSNADRIVNASAGNSPSSTGVPSLTNLSSESGGSPAIRAGSASKTLSTYQAPTQAALTQTWPFSSEATENCLLTLGEQEAALSVTPHFTTEEMSTLGIQFDPHFDAGSRTTYGWSSQMPPRSSPNLYPTENFPPFEMAEPFASQDGTLDSFNIPGNTPSFARSISSSPPTLFTPEQRELKRQRDLARRESKSRIRRERSSSNNSYNVSLTSTPDSLTRAMSYTSGPGPSSAPTESTSTFPGHTYLPPVVPNMASSESPELFGSSFPFISNEFGGHPPYLMSYSAAEQTIPQFISRPHSYSSASDQSFFYRPLGTTSESQDAVRVVHSRPKPQCWEHGCNGRQFSTFSNLLRHQREKSGVASKPTCPKCGAEFTRTTARNGHMAHEKCKQRRNT